MSQDKVLYSVIESPVGNFIAGTTSDGCCLFEFEDRGGLERVRARMAKRYRMDMEEGTNDVLEQAADEIREYFERKRRSFSIPLDLRGTKFEMAVWDQLLRIPFGETRAYGQIASLLGKPGAARAVGRANGANYLAIIVPCHRVIQEDGGLRGYGGGLWRKRMLLDFEQGIDQLFSAEATPYPSRSPA